LSNPWRSPICALLALACVAGCGFSAAAHAECQYGPVAKLPVTMQGMRASVPVTIKGQKADMWIDTGAFFNFMSRAKAAELDLRLDAPPQGLHVTGIGGSADVMVAHVPDVALVGYHFPRMDFLVGGSDAGNGFFGANLFRPFDSEFDLAHGQINLMSAKGCGKANLAYWAGNRFLAISPLLEGGMNSPSHIYTSITVNGVKMRAMLDTGAPGTILSRQAARKAGIDLNAADAVADGEAHGIGIKGRKRWVVKLKSFDIGGETIQNTPIAVIDQDLDTEDAIIGMDFFLSHHLMISRSQSQIYITYNGGPIFSLGTEHAVGKRQTVEQNMGGAAKVEAPVEAAELARRGAARLAQRDYDGAIADLSAAIAQKPDEADYWRDRALAYGGRHERDPAQRDWAQALTLRPDDPELLTVRARSLMVDDPQAALTLANRALKLAPKGALDNLRLAQVLGDLGQANSALGLINDMIGLHRDDHVLGSLLNARCWMRGLGNVDLDKAAKDCDTAIRRDGEKRAYIGSRGLIRLRQKDYAGALADFDRAQAMRSGPTDRYLRGIALIALGRGEEGHAEIAQALKDAPREAAMLASYGLTP
jgi:clan AA aspartic protease (TIGR02281 family)